MNTFFASQLQRMMTRLALTNNDLMMTAHLHGFYVDHKDVVAWRRGECFPQWDHLLLFLNSSFGTTGAWWLAPVDRNGLAVVDSELSWGGELMQSPEWGERLSRAMDQRHIGAAQLARMLTFVGFKVSSSTVHDWRNGAVPREGLVLVPWLSQLLRTKLQALIPDGTGPHRQDHRETDAGYP